MPLRHDTERYFIGNVLGRGTRDFPTTFDRDETAGRGTGDFSTTFVRDETASRGTGDFSTTFVRDETPVPLRRDAALPLTVFFQTFQAG